MINTQHFVQDTLTITRKICRTESEIVYVLQQTTNATGNVKHKYLTESVTH